MSACPHGMPSPASCMDCQYDGVMPEAPKLTRHVGTPYIAAYNGSCSECELPIVSGYSIIVTVKMQRGTEHVSTRYAHRDCA